MPSTVNSPSENATAETSLSVGQAAEMYDFEEQQAEAPAKPKKATPPAATDEPDLDEFDFDEATEDDTETDQVEEDDQSEEDAEEAPAEDEEADEPAEITDLKAVVKHPKTGELMTIEEALNGHMKDADYRVKTSKLSQKEASTEALATRLNQVIDDVSEFLEGFIPKEPDDRMLYGTRDQIDEYHRINAARKTAIARMEKLLAGKPRVAEVKQTLTAQQRLDKIEYGEAQKLAALPFLKNPEVAAKHARAVLDTAVDLGFEETEVRANLDPRMYVMAHYATLGRRYEKLQKSSKQKVVKVPPVAVPTRNAAPRGAKAQMIANKKGMSRLKQSGLLKDALDINF